MRFLQQACKSKDHDPIQNLDEKITFFLDPLTVANKENNSDVINEKQ